jgi:neutral ceramidase
MLIMFQELCNHIQQGLSNSILLVSASYSLCKACAVELPQNQTDGARRTCGAGVLDSFPSFDKESTSNYDNSLLPSTGRNKTNNVKFAGAFKMARRSTKVSAGVAQIDITPPVGSAMTGYIARAGNATGVHDLLSAKALVLDNGAQQAAIITCDVLGLHKHFVDTVRAEIEASTGIPGANVMITCSHTHAGPATMVLQGCGDPDEAWMATLRQRLVAVTQTAHINQQPAQFGSGRGRFSAGVHNRRAPGDIMDPEVGVLRVADQQDATIAILVNYACHPTCLTGENQLISAEYPGLVVEQVQRETGAITLFVTGAIGDVGPAERGWPVYEAIGAGLAATVLRSLPMIKLEDWQPLAVATQRLELPLQVLPTADQLTQILVEHQTPLTEAEKNVDWIRAKIQLAMQHWVERTRAAIQADPAPAFVQTEVQVIRLGDVAFVSAPGELFVELGLAVKYGAGVKQTFICGFANDNIGYIPARRAYPHGGYEVAEAYKYYRYPAALAPEAGEQFVETAIKLIHKGKDE